MIQKENTDEIMVVVWFVAPGIREYFQSSNQNEKKIPRPKTLVVQIKIKINKQINDLGMSHLHKLVGFNVLWAHVHGNMGCKVASNREQRDYLYIL